MRMYVAARAILGLYTLYVIIRLVENDSQTCVRTYFGDTGTMAKFAEENLQEILALAPENVFTGGVDALQVAEIETQFNILLPESYSEFLKHFGAAVWPDLIYGAGPSLPTYLRLAENIVFEQQLAGNPMPAHIIPVSPDGAGNHYALDLSQMQNGECPVVFWQHDIENPNPLETISENFVSWFLEFVREMGD